MEVWRNVTEQEDNMGQIGLDRENRDRGPLIMLLASILFGFSLFSTYLRLYTRHRLLNAVGLDDHLALAAMVLGIGHYICVILSVTIADLGKHIWMIPINELPGKEAINLKLAFTGTILTHASTGCLRASIMVYLLRLHPVSGRLRLVFRIILATIVGVTVSIILVVVLRCLPIQEAWSVEAQSSTKCMDPTTYAYIAPCAIIALSIVMYLAPIPRMCTLELPMSQKLGLFFVWHMAFVSIVGPVLQIVYSEHLINTTDPFWDFSYPVHWHLLEVHIMIISCSMCILKPFFSHMWLKISNDREVVELDFLNGRMLQDQQNRRPSTAKGPIDPMHHFLRCAPNPKSVAEALEASGPATREKEIGKGSKLVIHTFDEDFFADTPPSSAGSDANRTAEQNSEEIFAFGQTEPLPFDSTSTEDILESGAGFGRFRRK
ncbi:hypothetical protein BJ508DRAFT_323433 [Ascobolus immersus RN42]|uniref:Rhodopsin domain-containing protein n=1 Tax=Ascobolus immersus RN42 TaxID=1160509 RepID=A0A3N4III1_ASCIM|nr:hypothetical protein BJ508DRAFT_323433 [Ascobolus immersus RN42]